jgi:hypothetical protein
MIAAPILITVGNSLSAQDSDKSTVYINRFMAHRTQHIVAGMVAAFGMVLLIPAVVGLLQLVRARGAALATTGGVLAGIGAAGLALNTYLVTVVTGVLTVHHRDLAIRVQDIGRHSNLGGVGFFLAPAFGVGVILIAASLLRAKAVPTWMPILLIVGAVALIPLPPPFGGILITVAFIAHAVQLWQRAHSTDAATAGVPRQAPKVAPPVPAAVS